MGIERAKSFNVIFTTSTLPEIHGQQSSFLPINVDFWLYQVYQKMLMSVFISITDDLPRISTVLVPPQIQLPQGCRLPRYSAEVCIGIRPLFASPLEWIRTTTKATISSCFPKTLKGHAHNIKNQTYHTKTICYPITWNDLNVICQIFFWLYQNKGIYDSKLAILILLLFFDKKKEST